MKSCRYTSRKGGGLTPFRVMHRMLWGAPLAIVLVACGGGGGSHSGSGGSSAGPVSLKDVLARPLGQEVACRLQVYPTVATPGDVVTITGLPDAFGEPGFRVLGETVEGETVITPLFANQPADNAPAGEVTFSAPLHPANMVDGGQVRIEIGDGEQHCAPFEFTIEPLLEPVSDQEKDASDPEKVLAKLQDWVDENIQRLGYDPEEILAMEEEGVPPQQIGLWLAKKMVSSADPGALPAIAQSAAERGDDLLPRLLFTSGLANDLDDALDALNTSAVPDGTIDLAGESSGRMVARQSVGPFLSKSHSAVARASRPGSAQCGDVIAFDSDKLKISDTEELSLRMRLAREGMIPDSSAASRILGGASFGAEFFKGAAAETIGDTAGYADIAINAVSYVEKARLALEPKRITSFTVEPGNNKWVEDRPSTDTEIAWLGAKVKAEGDDFNVSKVILESLITAYGMVPGPVGVATTVDSLTTGYVQKSVDDITGGACIRISAPSYGPYPVGDADIKEWTKVNVEGDTIALDPSNSHNFYGTAIGQSALRIGLNSEKFPLPFPNDVTLPIFVQQVAITSTPPFHHVQTPGEEFSISAMATNAYGDSLGNISAAVQGGGSIVSDSFNPVSDEFEVIYKAPNNFDDLPASVVFNWVGGTLPGGGGRQAETGFDKKGKITLSPESACLMPGEELDITATIEGFPSSETIAWLGNVRSDDEDNLTQIFTAPSNPDTYTVKAFDTSDEDVFDEVIVEVSESCVKKAWLPTASSVLDANGTYGYSDCAEDSFGDDQGVDNAIEPPQDSSLLSGNPRDSDLWVGESVSTGGGYLHNSTRWTKDDDDNCQSVSLYGENNSEITFWGGSGSTLSFHADIDMTSECKAYADGDIECSGAGATVSGQGFYFLDVSEKKMVNVTGELSCSMLSGNLYGLPTGEYSVFATAMRYVGGVLAPMPGVSNPDGSPRSPQIFSEKCLSANDTVAIDESFVLDAPEQSGATDTVALQIILPTPIISPGEAPATFSIAPSSAFQERTYTAKGSLDFSIQLK